MSNIDRMKRTAVREQEASIRAKNFKEVCLGYDDESALVEAKRCLGCKNPKCVSGCPVSINIPGFISYVKDGDIEGAAKEIANIVHYQQFVVEFVLKNHNVKGNVY